MAFVLLCLAAPGLGAENDVAASATPAPLVLEGLGRATAPIDGPWQFHTGDDLAWASAGLDDRKWERIEVGKPWEAQGHYGHTGFAWYRRHLVIPAGQAKDWQLALFVGGVDSAYEVYWNGAFVGRVGRVPPDPVWYIAKPEPGAVGSSQPAGVFRLGAPQSGVLAIRAWMAPLVLFSPPAGGGLLSVPRAGSMEAVTGLGMAASNRWILGNQFNLLVVVLSSIIGVLALLTWLRNRERTMLFWLALAMFSPGELFFTGGGGIPGLTPFRVSYGLIGVVIGLHDTALWFLLLALLGLNGQKQLVRWTRIFAITEVGFDVLDGVLQLFDWSRGHAHFFLLGDLAFTALPVLLEFWGLVLVFAALRKRQDAARWMLAISALLVELMQAVDDTTGIGWRWRTHWTFDAHLRTTLFAIGGSQVSAYDIGDVLLLISIIYVAWKYSGEQSQRQILMEQEFRSAQELQQLLIPEALPELPGYAVSSAYRPAQEVGGDFFQLMALANGGALLVIGDVSGKGLPAAMAVALIVGAIRSTAETSDDPAAMLATLNRRLHGRLRGGFATCLAMRLEPKGNCVIANAGHLPPFLNGEEVELPAALPLGLMPDADYETAELRMDGGDRLTLYTDGLLEARNAAGELFGFERIAAFLAVARGAPEVADAAQAFGQDDDITVLTLTFAGA